MSEQQVLDHFKQVDFWQKLLVTEQSRMDWCDCLAFQVIIERIRGKDAGLINELMLTDIANAQAQEAFLRDPMDPQPQEPPTIEAVLERANELTALYQQIEKVAS